MGAIIIHAHESNGRWFPPAYCPANPTDSGSRFPDFNLPGSQMAEQNADLED